ncbi:MAG: calcium-binding protein, partial [Actinomycetota bacterium]
PNPDPMVDGSDHNGSSFNDGFYGHVSKDLRSILGQPVEGPFSRTYCGDGVLATCRTDVTQSLQDALDTLETAQGADMSAWDHDEAEDEIHFTSVGVVGLDPMPFQNRPTFPQVLQFSAKGCPGKKGANLTQIVGTEAADRLRGTRGRDVVCGFGGKDRLSGRRGGDILFGGGGKDRLRGQKGNDRLKGGDGNDRLKGGPGKDRLRGQGGKDRCRGGPGKDRGRCERGRT